MKAAVRCHSNARGKPDEKDLKAVKEFALQMVTEAENGKRI